MEWEMGTEIIRAWEAGSMKIILEPSLFWNYLGSRLPSDADGRIEYLESALIQTLSLTLMLAKQLGDSSPVKAGFRPGDHNPDLLTEEEAIRYLRLDEIDIKNPEETLQRYRKAGHLKGTQVSKRVFYQRKHLDAFLDKMTEINPR